MLPLDTNYITELQRSGTFSLLFYRIYLSYKASKYIIKLSGGRSRRSEYYKRYALRSNRAFLARYTCSNGATGKVSSSWFQAVVA